MKNSQQTSKPEVIKTNLVPFCTHLKSIAGEPVAKPCGQIIKGVRFVVKRELKERKTNSPAVQDTYENIKRQV